MCQISHTRTHTHTHKYATHTHTKQVKIEKVEQFMEEIRAKSRSRTITLGLARNAGGPEGAAALGQLLDMYTHKGRSGVWMCRCLCVHACVCVCVCVSAGTFWCAICLCDKGPEGAVALGQLLDMYTHKRRSGVWMCRCLSVCVCVCVRACVCQQALFGVQSACVIRGLRVLWLWAS